MTLFLWTMTIVGLLEIPLAFHCLVTGKIPVRTAKSVTLNMCFMGSVGLWAFWLLARGGQ